MVINIFKKKDYLFLGNQILSPTKFRIRFPQFYDVYCSIRKIKFIYNWSRQYLKLNLEYDYIKKNSNGNFVF